MSNLTDALIAAKLVGGSGGSGGGSGLPEITTTTTTIFAEQSVAFEEDSGLYYGELTDATLSIGASYTVTWDGVKYSCVAVDGGSDDVILGNLSLWEMGEDTGEPFLIDYLNNRTDAVTADSTVTHTVKITTVVQTPADGTVLVVAGGEWTLQSGYGYIDDGVAIPIEDDILPRPQVCKIVIQNDAAVTVPPSAVHSFSFDYVMLGPDGQPMPASQPVPSQFLTWGIVKDGAHYQGPLQVRSAEIRDKGADIRVFNTSSSSVTIPAGAYFHIICTNPYRIEVSQGSGGSNE